MPHYRIEEDVLEEYAEYMNPAETAQYIPQPDGQLGYYEPAEGIFEREKLGEFALSTLQTLEAEGVTAIIGRYDGGYDEGFAYFESGQIGDTVLSVDELSQRLQGSKLGEKPAQPYIYYPAETEAKMTPAHRAKDALDGFAYALASVLLGGSFGTGEMSLQGRFRANLATGEIVDIEEVPETEAE